MIIMKSNNNINDNNININEYNYVYIINVCNVCDNVIK